MFSLPRLSVFTPTAPRLPFRSFRAACFSRTPLRCAACACRCRTLRAQIVLSGSRHRRLYYFVQWMIGVLPHTLFRCTARRSEKKDFV